MKKPGPKEIQMLEAIGINWKEYREFYSMKELHGAIHRSVKVLSWGANSWANMADLFLCFRVQGHHHKGAVIIGVNGADLFDVYLVNRDFTLKEKLSDVYIEDLIDTIDKKVEYLPTYDKKQHKLLGN